MILPYFSYIALICCLLINFVNCECDDTGDNCEARERRYLLYNVNFGEGFNLRRDVYLRIANVVRQLRQKGHNYFLVLPPWQTPHWRNQRQAEKWSEFFDLNSLNRFVPVIEFEDYLKENKYEVENILYLQHYEEGWNGGEYVIKFDIRPCLEAENYFQKLQNGTWKSYARSLRDANFKKLRCLSIQGESSTLVKAILDLESLTRSLYVDRAETILHDNFGDRFYWEARRSMRYSQRLIEIGNQFRRDVFDSTNESDNTVIKENWEDQKPKVGSANGGNYLCVHWRRKDFVRAHNNEVPTIQGTVKQIESILKHLKLDKVFISTDAESHEYNELNELLSESKIQVSRFLNNSLSEGSISIVDQWICSHARYFIGTHVSTFSYRIHEDREIFGFSPKTTFNRLCPDNQQSCEQPAQWTITYD